MESRFEREENLTEGEMNSEYIESEGGNVCV